jgi:hypothetical protein
MPYVIVDGDWEKIAHTQSLEEEQINRLKGAPEVLLVELPHPGLQAQPKKEVFEVHPIDHHGEASEGPSSLEQFARLTGHELTQEEWKIAVADRNFLPGLSALGVSYKEMEALRRRKWKVRHVEDLMAEARKRVQGSALDLIDLRLVLVPEKFKPVMLKAAQWPVRKT